MIKHNFDNRQFFVRLGVTVAAVVLVMYLAKVWFIEERRHTGFPSQSSSRGQIDGSFSEPQKLAGKTEIISWQDAAKHYGEYAAIDGTIVATHNSGKACFLNFHHDYRNYFTAVIFASNFSRFPANPENYYNGKKVRVSGDIKEYKGKPEIILNDQNQIEILMGE